MKNLKFFVLLYFVLFSTLIIAQDRYYGSYLENFPWRGGSWKNERLRKALHHIISGLHISQGSGKPDLIFKANSLKKIPSGAYVHSPLSYESAKHLLYKNANISRDSNFYSISPLYCSEIFTIPQNKALMSHELARNFPVNIEHIWPKKYFKKEGESLDLLESFKISDLHHLQVASHAVNNRRGALKFAEVHELPLNSKNKKRLLGLGKNKIGTPKKFPQVKELFFEPLSQNKGKIARSFFYFSIRYELPIPQVLEFYLRKWHREYPVTQGERDFNDFVFEYQYNRNPIVDYPEIVEFIDDF